MSKNNRKLKRIKTLVLKSFDDCIGCGGLSCIGCQSHEGWTRCMEADILAIIMGEKWLIKHCIKKCEVTND